jgi:hypothetical protein
MVIETYPLTDIAVATLRIATVSLRRRSCSHDMVSISKVRRDHVHDRDGDHPALKRNRSSRRGRQHESPDHSSTPLGDDLTLWTC